MNFTIHRTVACVGLVAVLGSACGTGLTDDEIAGYAAGQGIQLGDADGVIAAPATSGDGSTTTTDTTQPSADTPASGGEATTDGTTTTTDSSGEGGATVPSTDGGTGDTTGDAGQPADPATEPGTPDGNPQQPAADPAVDTRAAPEGGNGGATDTGVTEDKIVIYNVTDRTGAVPGLFQDAQEAVAAYVLKFQSTEGTVYGRQVELIQRDAKMSTQENRSAYLDACNSSFAAVASMSAFEQGAAGPVADCSLPDFRTAAVSPEVQTLPTMVSLDAMKPDLLPISEWAYYTEAFPGSEKKAGYLWIDNATTTFQTQQTREITTSSLGYEWIHEGPIALSEVNYSSIIQQLADKGVELVAFQGAYQQVVRLAETMLQQEYRPKAFLIQSNTYTPNLITECGDTCDPDKGGINILLAQNGALVEEIAENAELTEYATWLARVNPRALPTGLGQYAWAAAKLFFDGLKQIGPEATRTAIVDYARSQEAYTGNDIIPPQNLKTQVPTDCFIMLTISDGAFVRVKPQSGYFCGNNIGSR